MLQARGCVGLLAQQRLERLQRARMLLEEDAGLREQEQPGGARHHMAGAYRSRIAALSRRNQAPLVAALAAAHLGGRDQLEAAVGVAGRAGGVLADALGFGEDLVVAHHAVDADRRGAEDDDHVAEQPSERAAEGQLFHAGGDGHHADEAADEPGMAFDQPSLVPAREA